MDCKAYRTQGRLEVKALYLEDLRLANKTDPDLSERLADAIAAFAEFNRCNEVVLLTVYPKIWHKMLNDAVAQRTQPSI